MKSKLLLIINIVVLLLSIAWLIIKPDFDSAIAAFTGLALLIAFKFEPDNPSSPISKRFTFLLIVSVLIIIFCVMWFYNKSKVITGIKGDGNNYNHVIIKG